MDAAASCARGDRRAGDEPVSDQQHADERRLQRTAKSCGPDAPTLASRLRMLCRSYRVRTQRKSASDGGKRARSPGRSRRKPLKPLRAGMPGDSGVLVVARVRFTNPSAHEAAGAAGTRHSPRPLWGGRFMQRLGRLAPRERSRMRNYINVIASGAKQSILPLRRSMDCFVASLLAMTAATRPLYAASRSRQVVHDAAQQIELVPRHRQRSARHRSPVSRRWRCSPRSPACLATRLRTPKAEAAPVRCRRR